MTGNACSMTCISNGPDIIQLSACLTNEAGGVLEGSISELANASLHCSAKAWKLAASCNRDAPHW